MKKLMIAAAIVCAAALSQAAALDWGFGGKVWVSEDGSSSVLSSTYTGNINPNAALCLIYVGQNVNTFALGADGKLAAGQELVDSNPYGITTSGKPSKIGTWNPATKNSDLTGYSNGSSFAIVFYDGANYDYVYSVDASGNVGSAFTAATTYTDMSGQTAFATQYATGGTGTAGAVNVPEPTSGLLLLLGVAGLALKRKRA